MRVKELIEELEKLPTDARVWSKNGEGDMGYDIFLGLDMDNEVMIVAE